MKRFICEAGIKNFIVIIIYLSFCLFSSIYMFAISELRNGLMALLFMCFVPLAIIAIQILRFKLVPAFTALVFLLCAGGLSGTIYELYTKISCFDTILHIMAGFIFAALGFSIMRHFVGKENDKKIYFACLVFAICFSLAIELVWELFEYSTTFIGFDMPEDTIVSNFSSYLLSGGHKEAMSVNNISQTIIYYNNGEKLVINGYLYLGLIDTINDMLVCVIGTIIFACLSIFGYYICPSINNVLIPETI